MNEQRQDDQQDPIYYSAADREYSLDNLPEAMDDKDGCRDRVREICTGSAT